MKNALCYYYKLLPTSIHQTNNTYRCYTEDAEYILMQYNDDLDKVNSFYQLSYLLLNLQIPCHEIILNINNSAITYINNMPYILLKVHTTNEQITFSNLIFLSNIKIDYNNFKTLICDNWYNMWTKKIDYLEYQISQMGKKYLVIRDSFNFFVGLAENSISLLTELSDYVDNFVICHKRIKFNDNTKEFYNPLNMILDSKVRDIAEYIKSKFFYNKYDIYDFITDLQMYSLNEQQSILLFSRLLFPSYYFDIYENIISQKEKEESLDKILLRIDSYIFFLKEVWLELNKYFKIPEVEWIIKM